MVLSRRQFLGLAGGAVGGLAGGGLLRAAAWPLLTQEDLLPGVAPTGRLAAGAWTTTGDRVRMAVLGDNGSGGRQALAVAARMARTYEQRPFGAVVLLGDISYYGSITQRWKEVFLRPLGPLIDAGVRFDLAIGNHDTALERNDAAAEEINDHLRLLGTPGEFYKVSHGPVDLFVLDSSMPGMLGTLAADQLDWLDVALAESSNQWRLVALHHPLYSSGTHGSTIAVRDALEPILTRHRVDLVLTGHDHDYERTHPQDGVTYVVSGGGCKTTRVGRSAFTAYSERTLQFLTIDVEGDRLEATCIRPDGTVADRFELRARAS